MARSYTVSFNITGAMDGSLLAAIQSAQNALKGLNQTARAASNASKLTGLAGVGQSLNAIQQAANKFRELKKAAAESQQALANAQKQAQQLGREYSQSHQKQIQELNKQKNALKDLKTAQAAANKSLEQYRAGWRHFRDERAIIKYKLHELGAKGRKIPRELLGTAKGNEIGRLLTQLSENKKALEAQRQKFREARDEAQKYAKQIRETQNAIKNQERLAAQGSQEFNAARANVQNLKASLQSQLEALQRLRSQLGAAGFNTSNFAASERALQSEIDRVNQSLQRQQQLLQARQNFNAAAGNLGLASAGMMGALYTAQQVAQPFRTAVDNAMTFEHAMSRVKALTQSANIRAGRTEQVEREMAALEAQARELGATTQFTMTQAAQAMGYLGMAGWKKPQIIGTMPGMLNLAAAAGADLAQTADIVSDNMTAMGVPVEQAGHFMDVYAYALTNSNARLSDFGETMKYAAPVAKSYGATLDETAAMVMMMANAGIKGSMAGTSLRMGLLRLAGPPKTATKEMEKLGLSLSDAQAGAIEAQAVLDGLGINLEGASTSGEKMTRVLMQLHEKTKDLSQDEMLAVFKGIFGVNAETGWLALFAQGPEVFMKYVQGLRTADGYSRQVAGTMMDDAQGAMLILESSWDAVQNSIGTALLGTVRSAAEALSPMLTSLSQFIDKNPAVVQAAAGIAAAFSGIIVSAAAVKLAFAGWKFVADAITLVKTGLTGLGDTALFGGLIGRIAALRTALFGLGGAATLGGWSAMFAAIATSARTAMTAVTGFFASLSVSSMASGAIAGLKAVGTAILGAGRAAMMFAFSPVGVALMALALAGMYCYQNWDKVAPVLSNIANIITGSLSGALQTIAPAIENVMSAFGNLFNVLGSSGILSQIGMLVTGVLATIATTIAGVLSTIINVAATIISTVANVISGIINLISNLISGNWAAAWENAKSIAVAAVEGIRDVIKGILDGITSTIENVGKAWSFITGNAPSVETSKVTTSTAAETTPVAIPTPEVKTIDTTTTQAALDAVGESAQNAATNMDGVQQATDAISQIPASIQPTTEALTQFPQSLQPTTDALAQFPASLEPVTSALADFPSSLEPVTSALEQMAEGMTEAVSAMSNALIQLGTEALNAATQLQTDTVALQAFGAATVTDTVALQMLGAAALATFVAIQMLGAAALGAYKGVADLGEAAIGAAGKVAGLGEAARSACAQLAAAGANAAAQVSAAASSIKVGSNAEGGIYQRGAFLTTFAEKSPEAAIPLNHSKRAQDLWTQTGQLLGILPNDGRQPNWSIKRVPRIGGLKMPRINFPTMTPPTFPTPPDDIQPQIRRMPRGLKMPRINFPQMTPPTFPEERQMPRLSIPQGGGDLPPINVTIHVTINGNADEQVAQRGIEAALPAMRRTFAEELAAHRREALRRSFA